MKSYREVLTKLQLELSKFNPNELIIVYYNPETHDLQFNQLNVAVILSYLKPLFLPKKGFRVGVLTQSGLNKLKYSLNQLLETNLIDDLRYIPDLVPLGTDWYRCFGSDYPVPERIIQLKYVNVTSRFMVWLLCMRYNDSSRLLYKLAKRTIKLNKKLAKPKQEDNKDQDNLNSKLDNLESNQRKILSKIGNGQSNSKR